MTKITKCLNEWNATVEALGQGKQSILMNKHHHPYCKVYSIKTRIATEKHDQQRRDDQHCKVYSIKTRIATYFGFFLFHILI